MDFIYKHVLINKGRYQMFVAYLLIILSMGLVCPGEDYRTVHVSYQPCAESEQNTVRQFDRINNSWDMTDLIVTRDNTSNLPTSVFISMRFDFGNNSNFDQALLYVILYLQGEGGKSRWAIYHEVYLMCSRSDRFIPKYHCPPDQPEENKVVFNIIPNHYLHKGNYQFLFVASAENDAELCVLANATFY